MYYHCRQFKYVTYAKVFPTPSESLDENLEKTYRWLGQYCGFFPQIWLSRSTSKITGVRNSPQNILFGFQDTSKSSITKYFTDIIHDMKSAGEEFDGVLRDWEKMRRCSWFIAANSDLKNSHSVKLIYHEFKLINIKRKLWC